MASRQEAASRHKRIDTYPWIGRTARSALYLPRFHGRDPSQTCPPVFRPPRNGGIHCKEPHL
ncbi:hypothetical protein GCM10010252_51270 [Streptomyces aureoverticillatus]|nr:hypothetical protein GCM10010252_51270 [Streptomyces aureoverticillatus]